MPTYNVTLKDEIGNNIAPRTIANNVTMADGRTTEVAINEKLVASDLKTIAFSGHAKDATITDTNSKYTSENVDGALDEVGLQLVQNAEQINSLDAEVDLKANKQQEKMIIATLLNGWGGTAQYAKNDLGLVTIRMQCTAGTIVPLTDVFILPVGYRPLSRTLYPIYKHSLGTKAEGYLYIHTDGSVRLMADTTLAAGSNYGSQITFYAG